MATIHESLTAQVDGITDTFTSLNDISGGIIVDHNGQVVNENDITILTANSFQLSFVPQTTPLPKDTVAIFVTPDRFDITSQVNGITNLFTNAPSDTSQGGFVAILNGQILVEDTTTIDDSNFKIVTIPQIGDKLSYIRTVETIVCDPDIILPISATVEDVLTPNAKVLKEINVFGIIEDDSVMANVDSVDAVSGSVSDILQVFATVENCGDN